LKVLKKIHIKAPSNLKALDEVLLQFNQICRNYLSYQIWLQCQLALAEGFTNAVRHAHRNLAEEFTIEIEAILAEDSLEIRIWDWGEGFDLQAFLNDLEKKKGSWLGNGRGIAILSKIADHLAYYPTADGRNCLLIVKQLSQQI
jgi:serine/threonine-protein kinase RsbW